MPRRRFRRISPTPNCELQGYQLSLAASAITISLSGLLFYISQSNSILKPYLTKSLHTLYLLDVISLIILIFFWSQREEVSTLSIPTMSNKANILARKLKKLFNDKQITDVLKLSNHTRYGNEMPEIYVWIEDSLSEGYIAIENIANWERAVRERFEQRVSGILTGKHQRFSVVASELTAGDSFIIFHIEDSLTSQRLIVNENNESLKDFINEDKHAITLAKNLVWHSEISPHMSIIARTRAGKSVLAGRYMARLMLLQGWLVEYNSAKLDLYVKEFDGQSDPLKIIERAEYWVSIMEERTAKINEAGKENYLSMDNMPDIAIFWDEIGNLNSSLEVLDKTTKATGLAKPSVRWYTAINRLHATGGSAGIHNISISQYATKEGFHSALAKVNASEAVIMLGGAADTASERQYIMSGFADIPSRHFGKGEGLARITGSGRKWEIAPHYYEAPWFEE